MFNLSGISPLVDGTRKLANARLSYLFEYMTNQTTSYKSSNEACNEVLEQTNTKITSPRRFHYIVLQINVILVNAGWSNTLRYEKWILNIKSKLLFLHDRWQIFFKVILTENKIRKKVICYRMASRSENFIFILAKSVFKIKFLNCWDTSPTSIYNIIMNV
jgi:hypothetical protein